MIVARAALAALGVALALALPCPAAAGTAWLATGVVDELDGASTHMASIALRWGARAQWEAALMHIGGRGRRHGLGESRAVVTLSRRFQRGTFHVLLGGGINERDDDVLSGHLQCLTGVGVAIGGAELSIRHLSNGSLRGRNRGETWLAVGFPLD